MLLESAANDNYLSLSELKYTCDECEYSTSNRSNLMEHIVSKQDENQVFPCDWCKFVSNSLINLKNHRERIHLRSGTSVENTCNVEDTCTGYVQEEHIKMENIDIKGNFQIS